MNINRPIHAVLRQILIVILLLGWLFGCSEPPTNDPSPSASGESHFLSTCDESEECSEGLSCICGRCQLPCSTAESPTGCFEGSMCVSVETETPNCAVNADVEGLCVPECLSDAECTFISGVDAQCVSGICHFDSPLAPPLSDVTSPLSGPCEQTADCDDELACVCGTCQQSCGSVDDPLGGCVANDYCRPLTDSPFQCEQNSGLFGVCEPRCTDDVRCEELAPIGYVGLCVTGICHQIAAFSSGSVGMPCTGDNGACWDSLNCICGMCRRRCDDPNSDVTVCGDSETCAAIDTTSPQCQQDTAFAGLCSKPNPGGAQ